MCHFILADAVKKVAFDNFPVNIQSDLSSLHFGFFGLEVCRIHRVHRPPSYKLQSPGRQRVTSAYFPTWIAMTQVDDVHSVT